MAFHSNHHTKRKDYHENRNFQARYFDQRESFEMAETVVNTSSSKTITNRVIECDGNIFAFDKADSIGHIVSSSNADVTGSNNHLFAHFGFANTKANEKLKHMVKLGKVSVHIHPDGKKLGPSIVNMYTQINHGPVRMGMLLDGMNHETSESRLKNFQSCLNDITSQSIIIKNIAFTYGIGCGSAGGNWNCYYSLIKEWAKTYPYRVYVVRYGPPFLQGMKKNI